eukprot:gene32226-41481_t
MANSITRRLQPLSPIARITMLAHINMMTVITMEAATMEMGVIIEA